MATILEILSTVILMILVPIVPIIAIVFWRYFFAGLIFGGLFVFIGSLFGAVGEIIGGLLGVLIGIIAIKWLEIKATCSFCNSKIQVRRFDKTSKVRCARCKSELEVSHNHGQNISVKLIKKGELPITALMRKASLFARTFIGAFIGWMAVTSIILTDYFIIIYPEPLALWVVITISVITVIFCVGYVSNENSKFANQHLLDLTGLLVLLTLPFLSLIPTIRYFTEINVYIDSMIKLLFPALLEVLLFPFKWLIYGLILIYVFMAMALFSRLLAYIIYKIGLKYGNKEHSLLIKIFG
ncbi:MAG: hypothetical protein EOM90_16905 [Alphaproteobacteria bacterium]|nr:hypothetical protein [Alphaproteobacteria bacterium]